MTTTAEGHAGLISTLVRRDFGLLWVAGLISNLGSWAIFVAVPLLVYTRTGSALATTMVYTVTVVPMLLASVAGVFVDRWDRRRTLIAANLVLAALTIPLLVAQSGHLWIIYASSFGLHLIGWNLIGLGAVVATLVAVPVVPVALVDAGFLGVFVVGWATNQQTLIQSNVADQFLGRTYGVLGTITAVTLIIGSLLAGAFADGLGVSPLLYGAVVCYVGAGLFALLGPRVLRRLRANRG